MILCISGEHYLVIASVPYVIGYFGLLGLIEIEDFYWDLDP